jgi:predicted PurR-regulated permease PerM
VTAKSERPADPPPPSPTSPSATGAAGAPPSEPSRARRLAAQLPRAGLLLFLIATLIYFHEVLMPFVLAIFVAYLIYPIVSRLERIPLGKRHPPRWAAVVSVYALLFTLGWFTVPPLVGNVSAQLRGLVQDLPRHFKWVQEQRKDLDEWVAAKLEVEHLSAPVPELIYGDVDATATGTLDALVISEEELFLPPPLVPEPEKPAATAEQPKVIQLFAVNVQLPEGAMDLLAPARTGAVDGAGEEGAIATDGAGEPGDESSTGDEAPPEGGDVPTMEAAQPLRFDEEKGNAFKMELFDAINAELKKPGLAMGVAAKIEREVVPALAEKHLGLAASDPLLMRLARNTGLRVREAVKQEDYAKVVDAYVVAGLETARRVVQEQLAGLIGWVTGLAHGIFDFFLILMLTAFFLIFFPTIRDYLRDLVAPSFRDDYGVVLKRIDVRLSGAIRGQVMICIVNAILTFPGLWFIGAHSAATNLASYSVLLSLVAGVLSMIPIFGVILSTVPMVLLALAQGSVGGALAVIAWICIIHAIEAYILNPNILGHSASMNPIIVVFALLAGKHVGGMTGALLAVPVASVVVSLFGYVRRLVVQGHEAAVADDGADRWQD